MRIMSLAAFGVAGLSLVLSFATSGTTNATPRRTFVVPGRGMPQLQVTRGQTLLRPRTNVVLPIPCATATPNPSTFTGTPGNYARASGAAVLGGFGSEACDADAGVGVGAYNVVGYGGNAYYSFIAGGSENSITEADAFIGAGQGNVVNAPGSFVGSGGYLNGGNEVSGTDSFLGGGERGSLDAPTSFLGGGVSNTIASTSADAALAGGLRNAVTAQYGAILGGYGNTASGSYGMIVGGNSNIAAGTLSFASGYHADAAHAGSFVWSDYVSGSAMLRDTATNQFVVRASGGTFVYSNEATTAGVKLAPGSGTWSSLSDRDSKTGVVALDDASILAKVVALPVDAWQYKTESGVRHVGPMAQDFYAAFGVGEDDRHITSIDEDGVALAAIKGLDAKLNAKLVRKDAEIGELRREVRRLGLAVTRLARER
jgi:hypothetical protein